MYMYITQILVHKINASISSEYKTKSIVNIERLAHIYLTLVALAN